MSRSPAIRRSRFTDPTTPSRHRHQAAAAAIALTGLVAAACGSGAVSSQGAPSSSAGSVTPTSQAPITKPPSSAGSVTPTTQAPITKPLRILNSFKATAIDPALPGAHWCYTFGYCEHPTVAPEDRSDPKPLLLESLSRIDAQTWKLVVRPGITFQNGKALDGQALAASLQRQIDKNAQVKNFIGNSKATVSGAMEVTLTTPKPNASLPWLLADQGLMPVYDAAAVEAHLAAGGKDLELAGKGIFTAPFTLEGLDTNGAQLKRNETYWAGKPALPAIEIRFVTDPQARLIALENGEADMALYPPANLTDVLKTNKKLVLRRQDQAQETLRLAPNVGQGLLTDVNVRKAISRAINYEEIAGKYMSGLYDPAVGLFPLTVDYALKNQPTDLKEARRILDAAGWAPGAGGTREKNGQKLQLVLLTYPQQPDTADVAIGVQQQLAQAGIAIDIRQVEDINATIAKPDSWNLALIFNSTRSLVGDPIIPSRRYFHSQSVDNKGKYGVADPRVDEIIEKLEATFDAAERGTLLKRLQDIVITEQAYMIIAGLKPFPIVVTKEWERYQVSSVRRLITFETRP
ncbi:MAG: ABC transporter substrate-binding protein [Acidimicrobiales bacterium]